MTSPPSDPTLTARCYRVVFDELKAVAVRLGANDRLVQDAMNAVEDWLDAGAHEEPMDRLLAVVKASKDRLYGCGRKREAKELCLGTLRALAWGDVNEAIEKVEAMQALAAQPTTPPKEAN